MMLPLLNGCLGMIIHSFLVKIGTEKLLDGIFRRLLCQEVCRLGMFLRGFVQKKDWRPRSSS